MPEKSSKQDQVDKIRNEVIRDMAGAKPVPQHVKQLIIIIIINLIYIAQLDTNGILTALYIVITYIQKQYVHI